MTGDHRADGGPAVLEIGFRPLFLAAGVWAALAIAAWLAALAGAWQIPGPFDPTIWHAHEMIFGFAAAAVGGFLLTAIPNWTGRPPLSGAALGLLAAAWLAGRVALSVPAPIGPVAVAALDLAYPVALAAFVLREIVAGKNRRNLPIAMIVALLALANALVHAGAAGWIEGPQLGLNLAIGSLALLVSMVGGRIVPAFTRNWLVARGVTALPAPVGPIDHAALATTALAVLAWVVAPGWAGSGWLALVAGVAHAARLARWQGHRTLAEPLLWVLHLAYAWLAVGFLLLGGAVLVPEIPEAAALHALTAGAFGSMILAVMTRASLGHAGRALHAGPGTTAAYLLVTCGALMRVVAPLFGGGMVSTVVSGILWAAGFALFTVLYLPVLLRPRIDAGG